MWISAAGKSRWTKPEMKVPWPDSEVERLIAVAVGLVLVVLGFLFSGKIPPVGMK